MYTMDFFLAMNKNKDMFFVRKQMQLEITILSKLSQSQTNTICFLSFVVPRFYIDT